MKRLELYNSIWDDVREEYEWGHMMYECGLQVSVHRWWEAMLPVYSRFPRHHFVIEPQWYIAGEPKPKIPDIVVVNDGGLITDICELKYRPFKGPEVAWECDIEKLVSYVESKDISCPVKMDTVSGQDVPATHVIAPDCRLHFIVVAQPDAVALCTETIGSKIPENLKDRFYHWKGQSGPAMDRKWKVKKAKRK